LVSASAIVMLITGPYVGFVALSNGNYMMGFRVFGIFFIGLALLLTFIRMDAYESHYARRLLPFYDDDASFDEVDSDSDSDSDSSDESDDESDETVVESRGWKQILYDDYVLDPRYERLEYGSYALGAVLFAISMLMVWI